MRRLTAFSAIAAILLLAGCFFDQKPDVVRLSGKAMGTTYNIVAIGEELDESVLAAEVDKVLASMNDSLSNWNPNSEVSRFSKSESLAPQPISDDFLAVMAGANEVHERSGGAFDVTLGPVIVLWGFGDREPTDPIPSDEAIAAALAEVGQTRLLTLDPTAKTLTKNQPNVNVYVAAIAKGYGIDRIAAALAAKGAEHYMVEIGGDLVTRGVNEKGEPWRIGIETPEPGMQEAIEKIIPVSNLGMATSGDYRNFFEQDGKRYSHIIDATTGRPITHATTSVTVLAEDAMMADAWATAMLALGAERGMEIAKTYNLAVYFISRDVNGGEGAYTSAASPRFTELTAKE
ncbi:MAG: thiamine biosynthesis protein ApbE [Rhodobacterales bacterium]|nr:MAG: thiamine biosynthesis protein ApbE [Rhodobacterales bacterium]